MVVLSNNILGWLVMYEQVTNAESHLVIGVAEDCADFRVNAITKGENYNNSSDLF